jgi:hypothetical protein
MSDFIEQKIIEAVRGLLAGRVNEILHDCQFLIPVIEFGTFSGISVVTPTITLAGCEQSEKERIIKLDVYMLTLAFSFSETPESELYCYAYSGAIGRVFYDNPTLGGVVDRAVVTGKKYVPPKKANCGVGFELAITLRITIEGVSK